jgi:hypothetical protein
MTDIHYKLRKKGGLIHQMHKSQSNVTIVITEFDNLRELNAYALTSPGIILPWQQTIRAEKTPTGKY